MTFRPILFSAPMVRAILEGRKTQTRRVMKPQPTAELLREYARISQKHGVKTTPEQFAASCIVSPYGQPGDRLWVREKWQIHRLDGVAGHKEFPNLLYAADQSTRLLIDKCVWKYVREKPAWRPSIHMPRWASRITLEIIGIRVERLQDISESDAIAEGIHEDIGGKYQKAMGNGPYCDFARQAYQFLWEDINGAESWATNPWVWVIESKRI